MVQDITFILPAFGLRTAAAIWRDGMTGHGWNFRRGEY